MPLAAVVSDVAPAFGDSLHEWEDARLDAVAPLRVSGVEVVRFVNAREPHGVDVAERAGAQTGSPSGRERIIPAVEERCDIVHLVRVARAPAEPGAPDSLGVFRLCEQGRDAIDEPHAVVAIGVAQAGVGVPHAHGHATAPAGVPVVAGDARRSEGVGICEQPGTVLGVPHRLLRGEKGQVGELCFRPGEFVAAAEAAVGVEREDVIALEVIEVAGAGTQAAQSADHGYGRIEFDLAVPARADPADGGGEGEVRVLGGSDGPGRTGGSDCLCLQSAAGPDAP